MKRKNYLTPEVELLELRLAGNFCESGGIDDYDVMDPPGGGFFDVPGIFEVPNIF